MAVFTVHQPSPRKDGTAAGPDRFAFVRDGFHFWAFLFGPVWMLWHALWLVLLIYIVATTAIEVGLWALGMSAAVKFAVGVLIQILVGCEAGTLRRWSLRRRWTHVGIVVAPDQETAERRFFESFIDVPPVRPAAPPPPPAMRLPTSEHDVIGLFPEPQPRP